MASSYPRSGYRRLQVDVNVEDYEALKRISGSEMRSVASMVRELIDDCITEFTEQNADEEDGPHR